jgi:hypothetical protein
MNLKGANVGLDVSEVREVPAADLDEALMRALAFV